MSDTAVTSGLLLETLRAETGRPDLEFESAPLPLSGGFYAEMLRFGLVDPPDGLAGDLVARIVPDAGAGVWEATVQRYVAAQGFPTPAVRMTVGAGSALGRYLVVMDHVDGHPPMAGLGIGDVTLGLPRLVHELPRRLARIAACLHALDPGPLAAALAAFNPPHGATTAGFVHTQVDLAVACGRHDLARAGERLLAAQPTIGAEVVVHGDLHPFNLLVGRDETWLVDWTVAGVGDPAFTVAFTELMLAHPPVPLPRAGAALLAPVGRYVARRFLRAYRNLTDAAPEALHDAQLQWHRSVHALRILVELAGWNAAGAWPQNGHPWLVLEPVAARLLGLDR